MRALDDADPAIALPDFPAPDLTLIERLKKEVDHQIRSDLQRAARLADFTYRLSQECNDPQAQALHVPGHYGEAVELYEQAAVYQRLDNRLEAARVVRTMIDALRYLGRYDRALELATQTRHTLETLNESALLAQLWISRKRLSRGGAPAPSRARLRQQLAREGAGAP
jgi:tetratricopeptide (TPR) repeat protein